MEIKEAMNKAAWKRPVLARVPISGDADNYILCRRIAAVSYVVPESGGPFWAAECIEMRGNATYRVKLEDIREA